MSYSTRESDWGGGGSHNQFLVHFHSRSFTPFHRCHYIFIHYYVELCFSIIIQVQLSKLNMWIIQSIKNLKVYLKYKSLLSKTVQLFTATVFFQMKQFLLCFSHHQNSLLFSSCTSKNARHVNYRNCRKWRESSLLQKYYSFSKCPFKMSQNIQILEYLAFWSLVCSVWWKL